MGGNTNKDDESQKVTTKTAVMGKKPNATRRQRKSTLNWLIKYKLPAVNGNNCHRRLTILSWRKIIKQDNRSLKDFENMPISGEKTDKIRYFFLRLSPKLQRKSKEKNAENLLRRTVNKRAETRKEKRKKENKRPGRRLGRKN